jgi:hypothetical protein
MLEGPMESTKGFSTVGKREYASYNSGADVRIYFGDLWVDEISEIEFGLHEQVAPIFGYASHTFDRVARGNRYVQGQFVINFKESGYLQTVINSLRSRSNEEPFDAERFKERIDSKGHREFHGVNHLSVEALISNFDTMAQGYEDALWGEDSDSSGLIKNRSKDTFFYRDNHGESVSHLKEHGFNILLTYGENSADSSRGSKSAKTSQTIMGVQLMDVQQRVDPSGTPVSEVYSFIAKDISGAAADNGIVSNTSEASGSTKESKSKKDPERLSVNQRGGDNMRLAL